MRQVSNPETHACLDERKNASQEQLRARFAIRANVTLIAPGDEVEELEVYYV